MLGQYNLLPLLKGWEYHNHVLGRTNIVRGATSIKKSINERGWLHSIGIFSTDCYAKISIKWQGAELQTNTITSTIEDFRTLGAVCQDPSGWLQKYFRPNPFSTAGLYTAILFSGGGQGSVWPYVPTVKVELSLETSSTQKTAYIDAVAGVIAITDLRLFTESLRALLGIEGKLDPKWLSLGPMTGVKGV
jgi:hypothetical protein